MGEVVAVVEDAVGTDDDEVQVVDEHTPRAGHARAVGPRERHHERLINRVYGQARLVELSRSKRVSHGKGVSRSVEPILDHEREVRVIEHQHVAYRKEPKPCEVVRVTLELPLVRARAVRDASLHPHRLSTVDHHCLNQRSRRVVRLGLVLGASYMPSFHEVLSDQSSPPGTIWSCHRSARGRHHMVPRIYIVIRHGTVLSTASGACVRVIGSGRKRGLTCAKNIRLEPQVASRSARSSRPRDVVLD
mmetsp:Transcript_20237/g.48168  ORF Transcript_20237/g.48168 Transcript_20237/m.48168 type:complete len:247 (+) Transcript_20237:1283-2023(+)